MGLRCRAGAVLVAAAAVVSMAWARPAAAQRPIKRVLMIHAGPEAFPGNTRFDEVITKVLYSHPSIEVDYYAEFLEYEEFGVAADTSLRDYIRMKFRDRPLDALIVRRRAGGAVRASASRRIVSRRADCLCLRNDAPRGTRGKGRARHRRPAGTLSGRNVGPGVEAPSSNQANPCGGVRAQLRRVTRRA